MGTLNKMINRALKVGKVYPNQVKDQARTVKYLKSTGMSNRQTKRAAFANKMNKLKAAMRKVKGAFGKRFYYTSKIQKDAQNNRIGVKPRGAAAMYFQSSKL